MAVEKTQGNAFSALAKALRSQHASGVRYRIKFAKTGFFIT
jgi:hypothetical protein